MKFIVDHLDGLEDHVEATLCGIRYKDSLGRPRCLKEKPGAPSLATLEARVQHLAKAHRVQGLPSPAASIAVRETLSAARRSLAGE